MVSKIPQPTSVAVIGAGPAGLTVALKLAEAGVRVDVYESSGQVGGMAKTVELWGQLVDLGPHRFFSNDPRVNAFWLEVVGTEYMMVNRLTRILYNNKFFQYPLRAGNALRQLGLLEAFKCLVSYLFGRVKRKKLGSTFEDWVIARFGKRLYQIFFQTYSEKLWGIPCTDLDSDFAAQRIKGFSLYEAIKSALWGSRKQHRTLVDEFAYPNQGTGFVYESMARRIESSGGRIIFNCPIDGITTSPGASINLKNGTVSSYDHIVSTMPLTNLVKMLAPPHGVAEAVNELRFRNTILVYLLVEKVDLFSDQWLYIHSRELRIGRISNFQNWSTGITRGKNQTILCLELWCNDDEQLWSDSDEALISLGKDEISRTGLIGISSVKDGKVVRIPKCYPVYKSGYKDNLQIVINFLKPIQNLTVIGRYGSFKYNNQDHSILMGLLASSNLLLGETNDLWALNSDYEYQESSKISATGLLRS